MAGDRSTEYKALFLKEASCKNKQKISIDRKSAAISPQPLVNLFIPATFGIFESRNPISIHTWHNTSTISEILSNVAALIGGVSGQATSNLRRGLQLSAATRERCPRLFSLGGAGRPWSSVWSSTAQGHKSDLRIIT
ncbi:uncharacterized protein NFIA_099700 [Aspergillus fischeri NRRL 181]|uniref:Uncharacterized protein n=1 Tax=Neosartorya fischeri (strain ATCC 1020 / DSM 3700 / CBS 544.65 / FGSC A1164 / JCM 1740 / NRRL 181 / WB 181) TaxID=331117 RepID=A1DBU4_NEOFI|nr:uncharacterized protein NFIA_099700 [Aspergillus fischeri NRRL 181]EAW20334.1 hypothetical protein NFIA_099700 [Aspergillus fischeri NRRL 181]